MTLHTLADRAEAASGADRELDAEIDWTIQRLPGRHPQPNAYGLVGGFWRDSPNGPLHEAPGYSASLDAAMTLVPSGWKPMIAANLDDDRWRVALWQDNTTSTGFATAATPALALVAASLRALAAGEGKG